MNSTIYESKIDWWVPAVVVFTVALCTAGPLIDNEGLPIAIIMGAFLLILELVMFGSVKYQICDGRLGIRNIFYRWEWFPIDKMSQVRKTHGIIAGAALSTQRVSIQFADRSILKSAMPLEISPKDCDAFITHLRTINPNILVKD